MATKKKRIKCLFITSTKGIVFFQTILNEIVGEIDADIQFDFYSQFDRNVIAHSGHREKDFTSTIISSDIIFCDLRNSPLFSLFEIGIARAIGKPIIFINEELFLEDLPDLIRQSYSITYGTTEELHNKLRRFLYEYLENPKRFTPRSIVELDTTSQIVVDLEKLNQRDFENLCFELFSRLGYKKLEWVIKDDLIDAVTTLPKKDPDGFEYEEYWLISFRKEFVSQKMLDIAIQEPEYFIERVYRNLFDSDIMNKGRGLQGRGDFPIILLFVLRGKENFPKKLIREISKRDLRISKKGYPFTFRIRWWDDQIITSLVQENLQLARRYFSPDALERSSIRLSYEELYQQYAEMNRQLQIVNQQLISERSRIEILERDAAWKLLSFTAAHRLGNPIDAIDSELSNLKSAVELNRTDVIGDIIKNMETPVERAKSIVSQFRNLSIAHEIKPEIISYEKLNEALNYAAKQAIEKKVKVVFDLKEIPNISIDIQKLSECFEEIIRNSLHFIKGEHPKITIATGLSNDLDLPEKIDRTRKYIKITFSDNGCGVPPEKKKEIFKPFERGYIHGTGLGLAFCEVIIEKHGGRIREIGKFDEGAVFEIFLPTIG